VTPQLYDRIILPAVFELLGPKYDSREARAMLIAIALQESRLQYRRQIQGPARGYHQFETGGVQAVLTHRGVGPAAHQAAKDLGYAPLVPVLHPAFEHNDLLDGAFARLLLYADARPLPKPAQHDLAWTIYIFGWRQGKPHRQTWNDCYDEAWGIVL